MIFAESQKIDVETMGLAHHYFHPDVMPRPHRHNEVELNFIEEGAMTYLFGGTRAVVKAGQLALFWAVIPHQAIQLEQPASLYWVTIPFATFLQWQLPDVLSRQVICGKFVLESNGSNHNVNQALFRQWHTDLEERLPEQRKIVLLEVEARLRRLALTMTAPGATPSATETGLQIGTLSKVEQMACFIAEHYTEALHVEQVAHTVHLHPNYAMHLFQKSFGLSIIEYVTQYRLAYAQRLLIMTNANVSEIALEAGFGSVSRFYAAFKAACGESPKAYRASLQR